MAAEADPDPRPLDPGAVWVETCEDGSPTIRSTLLDEGLWDNRLECMAIRDEAIDAFVVTADTPTVSSHGVLGSHPGALATPVIIPASQLPSVGTVKV